MQNNQRDLPERLQVGAAYIRVSTDEQLDLSPESQLDEIKSYAKKNNILLQNEFIFMEREGVSGKKADKRLEFQKMIATAKTKPRPFDVILVWKFSRFARNQDESTFYKGTLRKKLGIDVISISEPIMDGMYGRLIETIIEWQDEFYSYNLSMEVRRGMKKKAEKGYYNGAMPLGYDKKPHEKLPTVNQAEANIIVKIFNLYTLENRDKNYIVRTLNDLGVKTKRGRPFTNECISYILDNPFYIGKIRWNRRTSSNSSTLKDESEWIVADSHHDPIIPIDVWESAQKKNAYLLKTHQKNAHPVSHTRHWLSGLVKCSVCGKSLSFKSDNYRGNNNFQCLGYRNGLHSESQSISELKLCKAINESLQKVLDYRTATFEIIHTVEDEKKDELELLQDEFKKISTKETRIKQAYIDGIDSIEEYKSNKEMLSNRKDYLLTRITKINSNPKEDMDMVNHLFYKNVENVLSIINGDFENEKKATALRSIIKKIVFYKEKKELEFLYYITL